MKRHFLSLLLLAFMAAGAVLPAAAEKADRDKPMNAEADALRYDDLKQTSVFTGNVVITKGTTLIRGGQVEVSQDPEGYQLAVATAAPGKLAYYRKKRDGVDEYIEGEGERIEYDSRADLVKFIKRAVVRRYKGATLSDETTGGLIVYDNNTDVFTVDGGAKNQHRRQSRRTGSRHAVAARPGRWRRRPGPAIRRTGARFAPQHHAGQRHIPESTLNP